MNLDDVDRMVVGGLPPKFDLKLLVEEEVIVPEAPPEPKLEEVKKGSGVFKLKKDKPVNEVRSVYKPNAEGKPRKGS